MIDAIRLVRTNRAFGALAVALLLLVGDFAPALDLTSAPVTLVVAGGLGTVATVVTALALRRSVPSSERG